MVLMPTLSDSKEDCVPLVIEVNAPPLMEMAIVESTSLFVGVTR